MILAWLCRFKILHQNRVYDMTIRSTMFNNAFYLTAAFREKSWFYGGHFKIGHNDQLFDESSIGNLILT